MVSEQASITDELNLDLSGFHRSVRDRYEKIKTYKQSGLDGLAIRNLIKNKSKKMNVQFKFPDGRISSAGVKQVRSMIERNVLPKETEVSFDAGKTWERMFGEERPLDRMIQGASK